MWTYSRTQKDSKKKKKIKKQCVYYIIWIESTGKQRYSYYPNVYRKMYKLS